MQKMKKKKRKSIRLKGYDYSQGGVYFVTICTHDKINLFWEKVEERGERKGEEKGENMVSPVRLNVIGLMIDKWWRKIFEKYYDEIEIGEHVIMPNHVHGIINIVGANPCIRPKKNPCIRPNQNACNCPGNDRATNKSKIPNRYEGIGKYISWFKRMSTNEYIRNVKNKSWLPFNKFFWQRNYYEHIIRDENDLNRIREYIVNNPLKWAEDKYYQNN